MMRSLLPFIIVALLLPACTYQQGGAAAGGVAGGMAGFFLSDGSSDGTRAAATVAGAVVGGLIGGAIGNYMDKTDQKRVREALKTTPKNKSRNWTNPKTGNRFTIKPIGDIAKDGQGREYRKATLYGRKKDSDKLDVTTNNFYL